MIKYECFENKNQSNVGDDRLKVHRLEVVNLCVAAILQVETCHFLREKMESQMLRLLRNIAIFPKNTSNVEKYLEKTTLQSGISL